MVDTHHGGPDETTLILILSSYLVIGCAEPALVVGQPAAIIDSEDVVIYYTEPPRGILRRLRTYA